MKVYNGKVYGVAVSNYGLEKGYLYERRSIMSKSDLWSCVADKVYISITASDEEAAAFNEWAVKEFLDRKESC